MGDRSLLKFSLPIWLLIILFLVGCQKLEQPRTELTQSQWRQIQTHLLDEAPEPEYRLDARFADQIELIGFDVDGDFVAGQELTITWYWKVLEDVHQDWKIFVHFDSQQERLRQNLDHYPLQAQTNNIYRTYHWRQGQIIADAQRVTIRDDYPAGEAIFYVGLFRGETRAPISNDARATDDHRAISPTMTVANPQAAAAARDLPRHTIPRLPSELLEDFEVDGRMDEAFWRDIPTMRLTPFSAAAPYATTVKVGYTDDAIIVGARMEDEHIWAAMEERDDHLWNEEVLEIFLAPYGPGEAYVELQVNPLGTIFDAYFAGRPGHGGSSRSDDVQRAKAWNHEGLQVAVHVEGQINDADHTDEFWSVEMVIPFDGLDFTGEAPEEGEEWRVNLYRFDRPDENTTHSYGWSTGPRRDFHDVAQFGHWTFGPELQPAPGIDDLTPEERERLQETISEHIERTTGDHRPRPIEQPGQ